MERGAREDVRGAQPHASGREELRGLRVLPRNLGKLIKPLPLRALASTPPLVHGDATSRDQQKGTSLGVKTGPLRPENRQKRTRLLITVRPREMHRNAAPDHTNPQPLQSSTAARRDRVRRTGPSAFPLKHASGAASGAGEGRRGLKTSRRPARSQPHTMHAPRCRKPAPIETCGFLV